MDLMGRLRWSYYSKKVKESFSRKVMEAFSREVKKSFSVDLVMRSR